jgi:hypothetical protein
MGNCPSKRGDFPAKLGLDQEERELQEALRVQAMNDVGKYPEIWDRIQQGISVQWHYLKNKCLKINWIQNASKGSAIGFRRFIFPCTHGAAGRIIASRTIPDGRRSAESLAR